MFQQDSKTRSPQTAAEPLCLKACKILAAALINVALPVVLMTESHADEPLPAISGFNGLISIEGGISHTPDRVRNQNTGARIRADAKVAAPLDLDFSPDAFSQFGLRLGVSVNAGEGADSVSATISPIWRDPNLGFLSLNLSVTDVSGLPNGAPDNDAVRAGVEGGVFIGPVTLRASYEHFEGESSNGDFGRIVAQYYPTENLSLGLGYNLHFNESNTNSSVETYSETATARLEWMVFPDAPTGLSFVLRGSRSFADSEGAFSVFSGFRVFMGPSAKPLIQRQRQDMF